MSSGAVSSTSNPKAAGSIEVHEPSLHPPEGMFLERLSPNRLPTSKLGRRVHPAIDRLIECQVRPDGQELSVDWRRDARFDAILSLVDQALVVLSKLPEPRLVLIPSPRDPRLNAPDDSPSVMRASGQVGWS